MLDVIKSYLVGLGFQVNQPEFAKAQGAINDLGRTVQSATSGMTKNFAVAATGITAALTAINTATAGFISQVADADMQYQKFALRLWTTKETAKELKTTLAAMGEDMEDVAWIPELRQQYFELIQLGRQMQTPGDASDQLKYVRSIMFEFKRMKLEVQYAMEWVSYYLIKYLGGPLSSIKKQLGDFNDKLVATMPEWTKKIAGVLATLMNVGISAVRFVKGVYDGFTAFFDMLPRGVSMAIKAFLGFWAILKFTPFGMLSMAIAGVLVLIEDFYGYIDGRKSSKKLAPIWRQLIDWFEKVRPLIAEFAQQIAHAQESLQAFWSELKKSDGYALSIKVLKDLFVLLKETIQNLRPLLAEAFGEIFKSLAKNGVLDSFRNMFYEIGKAIDDIFNSLTKVMKQLGLLSSSPKYKGFWSWFGDELSRELKRLAAFGTILAKLVQLDWAIRDLDFKKAGEISKSILGDAGRIFGANDGNGHGTSRNWVGKGDGSFESLVDAISGQESGGDYDAVNKRTGAYGRFQIMPANWPSWSEEAGLPPGSAPTPENQDLVARFKLKQYYDKYGARGAAIAWYAGEGALDYSADALNRKQGNGDEPSINEYADSITSRMYASAPAARTVSYEPTAPVSPVPLPAYTQAYAPAASTYANSSNVIVGDIYVTQANATPEQIQQAVTDGVQVAQGRNTFRQMRDFAGVEIL